MGKSALSKKSDEAGNLPTVTIYTDGSCLGNPGPGGYGAVLVTSQNGSSHRKEIYGGYRLTTNSRMEILAVLRALKELKVTFQVQIFSDSEYVEESISKGWLERWRSEDWMAKPNKPRTNSDLWRRVYRLLKEHSVTISWVKAHNGHPENERCDELARFAASQERLKPDLGYEGQQRSPK